MYLQKFLNMLLPEIPEDINEMLCHPSITLTNFEDKNSVLENCSLQKEIGYRQFPNGDYLVSMTCPMPGITPEMINWWFWWHPQESIRYQIWFPGSHHSIAYAKKDSAYFHRITLPEFQPNTQYPTERIGGTNMPLRIDFIHPKDFGFSEQIMLDNNIPLIVCGHVSAFKGLIPHTEMAHIFQKTEDGLVMISRFWIGKTLRNPMLRKVILTDNTAKDMAEHCCIEYRHLARILPEVYLQNNL